MSLFFKPTIEKVTQWQSEENSKKLMKALKSDDSQIQTAAIEALFTLHDVKTFKSLEKLLIASSDGIKEQIAKGFKENNHIPQEDKIHYEMLLTLQDKEGFITLTKDPAPFLISLLQKTPSNKAEFAADVLSERKWKPNTPEEKIRYALASNHIDEIEEIDIKQVNILSTYIMKQKDPQLRRKVFDIIAKQEKPAFVPIFEKFNNDEDEVIAEKATHQINEIQGWQAISQHKSKIERFFKSPSSNSTEQNATAFIKMGVEFLKYDLAHEAYCALALANYIYLELAGGYVIDDKYSIGDLTSQNDREIKIYNDFNLDDLLEKIAEKIRGQNEEQSLLQILQEKKGSEELDKIDFSALASNIKYDEFIDKTVEFLIAKQDDNNRAWRAILNYSDERIIPSLIETFHFDFLVFDPVQALIYLDKKSIPQLVECLNHENYYYRTNAAFALGIIEEDEALAALETALKKEKELVVQLFLQLAIMRIKDDDSGLELIIKHIDHDESEIRKCALRCLQHFDKPFDLAKLAKSLYHVDELTRLLASKVICNSPKDLSPNIIKKLVARLLEEQDNAVYEALVENLGERKETALAEALMDKLDSSDKKHKASIVSILGNMGYKPCAKKLASMYQKGNTELKQNILWSLGQIGAIEYLDFFTKALRQGDETSRSAALGAYFLSGEDEEKIKNALKALNTDDALIARGLLMDADALNTINSKISKYNDIQKILSGINLASIVKNDKFISNLESLLEYSNSEYYPADRYVRHGAIEALVNTII